MTLVQPGPPCRSVIAAAVERSTAASGVPLHIEDPEAVRAIADALRPMLPQPERRAA